MPPRHPVQAAPATEISISCRMSFLNFAPSPWAISASNASPVQSDTADVANAARTAKTMASQNRCASGRAMDAMARWSRPSSVGIGTRASPRSGSVKSVRFAFVRSLRSRNAGPIDAKTAKAAQQPSNTSVLLLQAARAPRARDTPLAMP